MSAPPTQTTRTYPESEIDPENPLGDGRTLDLIGFDEWPLWKQCLIDHIEGVKEWTHDLCLRDLPPFEPPIPRESCKEPPTPYLAPYDPMPDINPIGMSRSIMRTLSDILNSLDADPLGHPINEPEGEAEYWAYARTATFIDYIAVSPLRYTWHEKVKELIEFYNAVRVITTRPWYHSYDAKIEDDPWKGKPGAEANVGCPEPTVDAYAAINAPYYSEDQNFVIYGGETRIEIDPKFNAMLATCTEPRITPGAEPSYTFHVKLWPTVGADPFIGLPPVPAGWTPYSGTVVLTGTDTLGFTVEWSYQQRISYNYSGPPRPMPIDLFGLGLGWWGPQWHPLITYEFISAPNVYEQRVRPYYSEATPGLQLGWPRFVFDGVHVLGRVEGSSEWGWMYPTYHWSWSVE